MKKKEKRLRHKVIINLAKIILIPYIKIKYRYKYEKYSELKKQGPFLIIGNHTIPIDPILMSLSFPFHIYYFATAEIFNLGFISKLLKFAVNPIPKSKTTTDMAAIKKARKIVLEGGSIGLFPEGNVTYTGETSSINKSIVKLIRFLKIPVIIFHSEGLYFSNPRWSINTKKGRSRGYLYKIIDVNEYQNMSDDDLHKLITDSLYVNAYDQQEKDEVLFKGKDIALGLERLIFVDLKTNTPFVTYSIDNMILSKDSDFKLTLKPNGMLVDNESKSYTLIELDKMVKESYFNYLKENTINITEEIIMMESRAKERINMGVGMLTLTNDRMTINLCEETIIFDFMKIENISIQGKRKIIVYYDNKLYLIKFGDCESPYKYLLTYQFNKFIKGEDNNVFDVSKFGL